MAFNYLSWAWSQLDVPSGVKIVLIALADAANHDGVCWPNQEKLAIMCGCTRQTIVVNVGKLKKMGLLEIKRGKGNKVRYLLPDLVGNPDNSCRESRHLHIEGTVKEPLKAAAFKPSPEDAAQANEIIKRYPGYRLTAKEKGMVRGQVYNLVKKGLGYDTLAEIMDDFVECYDLAKESGERPRPWHPLKFFSDIERVTTPAIWRQVLAVGIDEDDWETILYRNSIDSEPRTYEKSED